MNVNGSIGKLPTRNVFHMQQNIKEYWKRNVSYRTAGKQEHLCLGRNGRIMSVADFSGFKKKIYHTY